MAFCINCGNELPPEANVCPNCGTGVVRNAQQPPAPAPAPSTDHTKEFSADDIENNKMMAIFCYLGLLLVIPMLVSPAKDSPFVRFHLNQGLILLLAYIASSILTAILVGVVGVIFCTVCMIMGIVNACTGKAKELPLIGRFRFLK